MDKCQKSYKTTLPPESPTLPYWLSWWVPSTSFSQNRTKWNVCWQQPHGAPANHATCRRPWWRGYLLPNHQSLLKGTEAALENKALAKAKGEQKRQCYGGSPDCHSSVPMAVCPAQKPDVENSCSSGTWETEPCMGRTAAHTAQAWPYADIHVLPADSMPFKTPWSQVLATVKWRLTANLRSIPRLLFPKS